MEYPPSDEFMSPSMFLEEEYLEMVNPILQEGSDITDTTDSITAEKTWRKKNLSGDGKMIEEDHHNEAEGSKAKRLEHNAKERIRRVRLKAAYSDLCALLPDSSKSKKGRSAAAIVDRVLKFIPEMETKIQKLKQVRDNMQLAASKKQLIANQDYHNSQLQDPTVSVTEIKEGEAIIQICTRNDHHRRRNGGFSNLLQNIEAQGMFIRSASTLCICDDAVCYQLHVEAPYCSQLPTSAFILTLLQDNQTSLQR